MEGARVSMTNEGGGKNNEKEWICTGEGLQRTEIGAVHTLEELHLVECKVLIARCEEWAASCISELQETKQVKMSWASLSEGG